MTWKINQPVVRSTIAFILFGLSALAVIGLCFTNAWKLNRVFFLASALLSLSTLLFYMIRLHQAYLYTLKEAKALKSRVVPVPQNLPTKEPQQTAIPAAVPSSRAENPQQDKESVKPEEPAQPTLDDDERNSDVAYIKLLLKNLEEKHVNVFEQKVQESEDTRLAADTLLEELIDIALLSMDLANIYNRGQVSYYKSTVDMILKDTTKEQVIQQLDGSIRLSKKYAKLSGLLHRYLPDSTFFYSSYKL